MALVGSHLALPASQLSQLHARIQRHSYQAWKHLNLVQTTSSTFVNFVMREAASGCWQRSMEASPIPRLFIRPLYSLDAQQSEYGNTVIF